LAAKVPRYGWEIFDQMIDPESGGAIYGPLKP